MNISNFILSNLEYIVAVGGGVGAYMVFKSKKFTGKKCNLTRYVIKYNKQKDVLNKHGKTGNTLF